MEHSGLDMPLLQPSAASSDTFRAAALALKLIPRDLRNDINRETRRVLNPVWREAVNAEAVTKVDKAVLAKGARVAPGNPTQLLAATSKRPLSGGLVPNDRDEAAALEFGSPDRNSTTTYKRKGHDVTRRTERQLPWRQANGRVVYAAFAKIAPRIASLWIQTIVRRIYEAHEQR